MNLSEIFSVYQRYMFGIGENILSIKFPFVWLNIKDMILYEFPVEGAIEQNATETVEFLDTDNWQFSSCLF